jgi:hypothetical protein
VWLLVSGNASYMVKLFTSIKGLQPLPGRFPLFRIGSAKVRINPGFANTDANVFTLFKGRAAKQLKIRHIFFCAGRV